MIARSSWLLFAQLLIFTFSSTINCQDELAQDQPEVEVNLEGKEDQLEFRDQNEKLQQIDKDTLPSKGTCMPVFELQSYLQSASNSTKTPASIESAAKQTFSFAIGDIDLPIASKDGSINSAIKLLSSFNTHLDPTESDGGGQEMENVVNFRQNHLKIQGLNLSMLNVHLYSDNDPKFGIGITIKNTTMTGNFAYSGPLAFTESRLAGFYRMSIENIYLVASSNLTKQRVFRFSSSKKSGTLSEEIVTLKTNDFKLNITNLGYISIDILDSKDATKPTTNYLLRMMQRVLQKTIKRTYYSFENYIKETLEREARHYIDCELTRFTPMLSEASTVESSSSANKLGDLARIINLEITKSQLDSVLLPNFDHQQSILGTQATIRFTNGSLSGLNHIHLTGETRIKLQEEHLFVNTSIGWSDLRPYYSWNLFLGGNANSTSDRASTSRGFVAFNIKGVSRI